MANENAPSVPANESPATEPDLGAIIGMIDYLIPEAQSVSLSVALHLHLARYELNLLRNSHRDRAH